MTIEVRGIKRRFGAFTALDDISFEVPAGSLMALVGLSGSGKSTILRIIAGLETPDRGSILLNGVDVTRATPQDRGIGFVFQHYAMFPYMTVRDNVAFGLSVRRRPKPEICKRVEDLLELVELDSMGDRYPSQLSGGRQQRVALARALAVEPSLLLLDEPFGALDARVRQELRAWLRQLHHELRLTTLLVTHDQREAMELADQAVVIDRGRVQQIGTPLELYDRPANAFVMSFVGPVTRFGGALRRPHDVEIQSLPSRDPGWRTAVVERVARLGFEVRVHVRLLDGERIWSQITQAEQQRLDLERGMTVYVKAAFSSGPETLAP
jgi:sulfate transport system ATP-binding protein